MQIVAETPANGKYPTGWHDPVTLNHGAALMAFRAVGAAMADGSAFYEGTRDQVETYRAALLARLEQPVITPAQYVAACQAFDIADEFNGSQSSVLLEVRQILKGLMGGAK